MEVSLKERREQLGLNQAALAHRAGVSEKTVRNLEQGKHSPNARTVRAIAEVLGISADEVMSPEASPA